MAQAAGGQPYHGQSGDGAAQGAEQDTVDAQAAAGLQGDEKHQAGEEGGQGVQSVAAEKDRKNGRDGAVEQKLGAGRVGDAGALPLDGCPEGVGRQRVGHHAAGEGVDALDPVEVGGAGQDAAALGDDGAVRGGGRQDDIGGDGEDIAFDEAVGGAQAADGILHPHDLGAAGQQQLADVQNAGDDAGGVLRWDLTYFHSWLLSGESRFLYGPIIPRPGALRQGKMHCKGNFTRKALYFALKLRYDDCVKRSQKKIIPNGGRL